MKLYQVVLLLILLAFIGMILVWSRNAKRVAGIADRWWMSEGFQNATASVQEHLQREKKVEDRPEMPVEIGPSPVELFNRQPYVLLDDRLAVTGTDEQKLAMAPTARACYEADFSNKLSLLGSYRQMTNNYRHAYPDNCSALNKDLSMNFYSA